MLKNKFFKVFMVICAILSASLLLCPDTAQAGYLDPGSGSTLVQGIIATIAAAKRLWRGFLSIFGIKNDK